MFSLYISLKNENNTASVTGYKRRNKNLSRTQRKLAAPTTAKDIADQQNIANPPKKKQPQKILRL